MDIQEEKNKNIFSKIELAKKVRLQFFLKLRENWRYAILSFCIAVFISFFLTIFSAPKNFPLGRIEAINPGSSLQKVAQMLKDDGAIRSTLFFRIATIILGGDKKVVAGDYLLDERQGTFILAYRIISGHFGIDQKKLTIPEGWNRKQIADYLSRELQNFDKNKFLKLTLEKEGYLFPDTYFVSPSASPEYIADLLQKNFYSKTNSLSEIKNSNHLFEDIIKMASILEEEARTDESRKIVAGILWKRLSLKMPLQVDSTLTFLNGKTSAELTVDDLKINSPFNTYINTGLPPTPISNPGLNSILAALNSKDTPYLYFLTGKDGNMYYAKTFEEHILNKQKYLNKF